MEWMLELAQLIGLGYLIARQQQRTVAKPKPTSTQVDIARALVSAHLNSPTGRQSIRAWRERHAARREARQAK
jgi:hypothetical protein